MSLLSGLNTAADVVDAKDTLGGSKFGTVESGIYSAEIEYAYLKKSAKGSLGLYLGAKLEDGHNYKETLYITTSDEKGNTTYSVKKDGTKTPMSGFTIAEALSLFGAQKPLNELDTPTKVVKIYDYDLGKEVPTEVPMITALIGTKVQLGIKKVIEDKKTKTDSGQYVATGETREINQIDKVFHATSGKTVPELRAKKENAEFIEAWRERWEGKTQDRSTGGAAPAGKAAAGKATANAPASSLFAV